MLCKRCAKRLWYLQSPGVGQERPMCREMQKPKACRLPGDNTVEAGSRSNKSNVKYKETSVELSAWRLPRFCISPNAYKQMTRSKRLFKVISVAIVDEA